MIFNEGCFVSNCFWFCGFVGKNVVCGVCFLSFCLQMKTKMCNFVAEVVVVFGTLCFFDKN